LEIPSHQTNEMEAATKRIGSLKGHLIPEDTHAMSTNSCNKKNICPITGYDVTKTFPKLLQNKAIHVLVTGAAGNIAYSLVFMIANGGMFGRTQPVILHLLDIPPMVQALKGLEMELIDGAFPVLKEIIATVDVKTAFMHVDVAILVGAFPRQKGMERKDLLRKNAAIFKEQGKALDDYASRDVKVLVVGNPANTNCWIAQQNAPNLPPQNFSALTRLDQNRGLAQVAQRLKVPVSTVHNVVIWGNHSATQYPDVNFAYIKNFPDQSLQTPVRSAINDDEWIQKEFIATVQQRGAKILEARKLTSAASAAHAIIGHIKDWLFGTPEGEIVSMAIVSDGSYNVPKGIVFSFPVTCRLGNYIIVQGLAIDNFSKKTDGNNN